MAEAKKYHYAVGEVKTQILKLILMSAGPVAEPDIRKNIQTYYESVTQATINRHLNDLLKDGCVELIPPSKKTTRANKWDIVKKTNLPNIREHFEKIQLNEYEKTINVILRKFGIGRKSQRYVYFFILLRLSESFFLTCMNTDIELLKFRVREIFYHDKGLKNEQRIEELLKECNAEYIKGKLCIEMSGERFREIMEELATKNDEILEEYAWRVCHCYTEQVRKKWRSNFTGNYNVIQTIQRNRSQNPNVYPLEPIPWVESFFMKFVEKVPELCKTDLKTILKTPDEYLDMCLKMEEILSLMRAQNKTFDRRYLDLLFEHFYYQDILDGAASLDEKTFAQNSKKNLEEDSIDDSEDYIALIEKFDREIISGWDNISKVIAKYKMPSLLDNISDDPKEVLRELLLLHGYPNLLKYIQD